MAEAADSAQFRTSELRDLQDSIPINDNSSPVDIPHNIFQQLFGFEEFQPDSSRKHTAESFEQVQRNFKVTKAGRASTLISLYKPERQYSIGNYQNLTLQV